MKLTITNNFYSWLRTLLLGTTTSISGDTNSTNGTNGIAKVVGRIVDISGNEQTRMGFSPGSSSYGNALAQSYFTLNYWETGKESGIYFKIGGSSTPATEDDYALGSEYTLDTDYTASWRMNSYPTMVDGKARATFNLTITANKEISVSEVGLMKLLCNKVGSSSSSGAVFFTSLFGRVVFDTPVELKEGESTTFQIDIEI